MRLAVVVSTRGTCLRASVGAIIVQEGRIISTGYVGAPSGQPDCLSSGCEIGDDGGCSRTVHAEANAIAFAARFGTRTDGAELHCTHAPCLPCAKLIVNAGIQRFVYDLPYRDVRGLELLISAGLAIFRYIPEVAEMNEAEARHERLLEGASPSHGTPGAFNCTVLGCEVQGHKRRKASPQELVRDISTGGSWDDYKDAFPAGKNIKES